MVPHSFFARQIKPEARPVDDPGNPNVVSTPADCRLTAFPSTDAATRYWIKGYGFTLGKLLGSDEIARHFIGGPMVRRRRSMAIQMSVVPITIADWLYRSLRVWPRRIITGESPALFMLLRPTRSSPRAGAGNEYCFKLMPSSLHRWHSPVDGTVISCLDIPGTFPPPPRRRASPSPTTTTSTTPAATLSIPH